jgi:hypothetical protein
MAERRDIEVHRALEAGQGPYERMVFATLSLSRMQRQQCNRMLTDGEPVYRVATGYYLLNAYHKWRGATRPRFTCSRSSSPSRDAISYR